LGPERLKPTGNGGFYPLRYDPKLDARIGAERLNDLKLVWWLVRSLEWETPALTEMRAIFYTRELSKLDFCS